MSWQNVLLVYLNETGYHLSVSVGMYADEWIFKVDNMAHTAENQQLLPYTIYLRFDRNKEYLSSFPARAVPVPVSEMIAAEIKKQEDSWIKGISR